MSCLGTLIVPICPLTSTMTSVYFAMIPSSSNISFSLNFQASISEDFVLERIYENVNVNVMRCSPLSFFP